MKGITTNPALDAYQRTAVTKVNPGQRSVEAGEATSVSGGSQAARVSISSEARALASEASDVDQAKVERLRAALANGTLSFDSSAIAEKLIDQAG